MSLADDAMLSDADHDFLEEVRAFYAEALTPELARAERMTTWTYSEFEYGRRWQKILHDRGWGAPHWPAEYGGTGWTPVQRMIWDVETARASPPAIMRIGRDLCAPAIMAFGTDEQKREFLPRILSGEDWWAQGFSEPGAGSDLASLQMSARREGDEYVLNGTKIWTTYAQHANRIFCLVRTATGARRQEGITALLIDVDTPGIEVRPVINLAGGHEFNEIFFTDARVPVSRLLGEENQGWAVARHLLKYEHGGGHGGTVELRRKLAWLWDMAALQGDGLGGKMTDDPDFLRRFSELSITTSAVTFATTQAFAALKRGDPPPPSIPLLRLRSRDLMQRITELGLDTVGHYGAVYQPEAYKVVPTAEPIGPEAALLAMPYYLSYRGASIAGGTPEIQRNNLARNLLGL